jgi:hypothetical protein
MFSHTTRQNEQSDIILTLTPHIIRVLDLTESDLRPFRVGRDSIAPLSELPLPIELPRPPEPPRVEPAPQAPQAPAVPIPNVPPAPIVPPAPR